MYSEGNSIVMPSYYRALELEANTHKNELRVFGQGEVNAKPDTVEVSIGVVTENKQLEEAQRENNDKSKKVIDAIKNLGIDSKDIRTENYNIRTQYDYVNGKQVFRGYEVDNFLRVIIRDINRAGQVIDTAVKNGANSIGNINFIVSNSEKYYNEALKLAVDDAQSKASSIADKLKVSINMVPIRIVEQTRSNVVPLNAMTLKASGGGTAIEAGENKITAEIEAIFTYS